MKRFSALFMSFLLFVILFISFVFSVQWSSPLRQFNVTPDVIYLNWTNDYASNITIELNQSFSEVTVEILNSTGVQENYFQGNLEIYCQATLYKLFVVGNYGYNQTIGPITDSANVTILDTNISYDHLQCNPGRYWIEKLTIKNKTQENETANITVFIDIPISSRNTINSGFLNTGAESFGGSLPENASTYHSYYFNITELSNGTTNVTGVAINLTWQSSTQDADIFLFDNNNNLRAKSINKTSTHESLLYNYLPSSAMWEIRVYGNSTSPIPYTGYIAFTGLNIINNSDGQRLSKFNLGIMNASNVTQIAIKLRNELNLTAYDITESKELYHVYKFSGSGSRNFTFLVPGSIVSKIKVSLNWTGGSNYSFDIYDQDNTLVGNSANKYVYSNITGAMQEEYNETSSIGTAGIWRVEVRNATNVTDSYDVFIYEYIPTTNWIVSNFTTTSLNGTFMNGNSIDIQINFTVQNTTMDGLYEGYIQYLDGNKAGIKIPLSINITTPMLVVNNTLSSFIGTVDENYGTNLTRSINFILNNTGFYNLSIVMVNSSNQLTCVAGSGCTTGHFANFTFNPITLIERYGYQNLTVNITYNSSLSPGWYDGWIYIYGNNSPVALSSHPYENFNITIRLNLTDLLNIEFLEVKTASGDTIIRNASKAENITTRVDIKYINGTPCEAKESLSTSNFTIWLVHKNVTSYSVSLSNLYNGSNPIYTPELKYMVNATVPANTPGGRYNVYVTASYTRNPNFSGTGSNQTLIINNTGLNLTCVSCPSSISNGSSSIYNISVTNYGWITASSANITFNKGTHISSVSSPGSTCGMSGTPGVSIVLTSVPNGTTCYVWWTITASTTGGDGTSTVSGTNAAYFNSLLSIPITVSSPSTTTTTTTVETTAPTTTSTVATTTTTTVPTYLEITSYPASISLEQGNSTTEWVKVKNANRTISQSVTLSILDINTSWYSIPTPTATIPANGTQSYLVNFNIPVDAEVGDYNGKFNASSRYGEALKSFVLSVIPSLQTKIQINSTLAEYQNQLISLEKEINNTKAKGYNTSEADAKLEELKNKINTAINYRDSGDYKSAYQTFDDIDTLFNETRTALSLATPIKKEFKWSSWIKWVIIGVIGVVAGFLGYLFWPVPGYKPEKGYVPQPKPETKDKFKDKLEKLRERWKKIRERKPTTKYIAPSV